LAITLKALCNRVGIFGKVDPSQKDRRSQKEISLKKLKYKLILNFCFAMISQVYSVEWENKKKISKFLRYIQNELIEIVIATVGSMYVAQCNSKRRWEIWLKKRNRNDLIHHSDSVSFLSLCFFEEIEINQHARSQ